VALDTRGDALLLGCILGFLVARGLIPRNRVFRLFSRVLAVLAVACLFWLLVKDYRADQGLSLLATFAPLSAAAILLALFVSPPKWALWLLEHPVLVWVGRISYGLYLWNYPLCYILTKPSWSWAFTVSIQIAATFFLATCSFYFWEQPFLRLKQKVEPA
jgi:peptidoglycan/LPS O-acetylase OafA/YrhL